MRKFVALILVVVLGLGAGLAFTGPSTAQAAGPYGGPERVFFPETGHTLAYGFLNYWHKNGGLPIFGYPITEEIMEGGLSVQYFERAKFEYHPENAEPYNVLGGLLGCEASGISGWGC